MLDPSPEMAVQIVSTIVDLADSLMRNAKREVAKKALSILEKQYVFAVAEAKAIDDSLAIVMKMGAIDLPYQAKELEQAYAQALLKGDENAARRLEKAKAKLAQAGATFTRLRYDIQNKSIQMGKMGEDLNILRIEAAGEIPSQFVIDKGIKPDKKSYPKKMIIVIVSTLAAVFFSIFLILLVDFVRKSINPPSEA